jgi:hypothetical protein
MIQSRSQTEVDSLCWFFMRGALLSVKSTLTFNGLHNTSLHNHRCGNEHCIFYSFHIFNTNRRRVFMTILSVCGMVRRGWGESRFQVGARISCSVLYTVYRPAPLPGLEPLEVK